MPPSSFGGTRYTGLLSFSGLNNVFSHLYRTFFPVKFHVETTCITNSLTLTISPPKGCLRCVTICAFSGWTQPSTSINLNDFVGKWMIKTLQRNFYCVDITNLFQSLYHPSNTFSLFKCMVGPIVCPMSIKMTYLTRLRRNYGQGQTLFAMSVIVSIESR